MTRIWPQINRHPLKIAVIFFIIGVAFGFFVVNYILHGTRTTDSCPQCACPTQLPTADDRRPRNIPESIWQFRYDVCSARKSVLHFNERPTGFTDRILLESIKNQIQSEIPKLPARETTNATVSSGQVANAGTTAIFESLSFLGSRPLWTSGLWDIYRKLASQGANFVVQDYFWSSERSIEIAYRALNLSAPRLVVWSSISPWIEATLFFYHNVTDITTVDWNGPICDSAVPIKCRSLPEMIEQEEAEKFDIIISFSGIEHDGLTRYGDPLNSFGDEAAMKEMFLFLKPGGYLLLGVPTNINWEVHFPAHRIYSPRRLYWITRGFSMIACVEKFNIYMMPHRGCFTDSYGWEFQPVFILRKEKTAFEKAWPKRVEGDVWNYTNIQCNENKSLCPWTFKINETKSV